MSKRKGPMQQDSKTDFDDKIKKPLSMLRPGSREMY